MIFGPTCQEWQVANWVNCKKPTYETSYRVICSQASGKTEEGSETRDTTVSPQRPTPRPGDDIVQSQEKSWTEFLMVVISNLWDWNYISGFFDADGSVQLNKIHKNQLPSPVITFHNNEKSILISIEKYIREKLKIKGTIVSKKKNGYVDQYELRYSYFSKCLTLMDYLTIYHPKKIARFSFIREYQSFSKRNGKYTIHELEAIKVLLKQWE